MATKDDRKGAIKLELIDSLKEAHLPGLAYAIEHCATTFTVYRCDYCSTMFGLPITCHERLCPRCSAARANDIWERHKERIEKARKPRHLTLTFLSVETLTPEYIKWAFGCFTKLWHRKFVRDAVAGALVSFEATHGPQGWHPHLHAFIDADYIPKEQIESAWKKITGGSYVCRIHSVHNDWYGAVREVVKYPTKVVTFYKEPELLQQFVIATDRAHLVRGYGTFYRIRPRIHLKREKIKCPVCGNIDYLARIGDRQELKHLTREKWGWRFHPHKE